MKIKAFLSLFLFLGLFTTTSFAQKIGHCNLEYILVFMPEQQQMRSEIELYRKKYAERLENQQKVMQDKYTDFMEMVQANSISEEEGKKREEELIKMQEDIQKDAKRYDDELAAKQEEKMNPIIEKLKKAIDEVAVAEGFTYILNSADASGTSIVLYGPKENDVTDKVIAKLGIKIPTETPAPAPTPGGVGTPAPKVGGN